MGQHSKNLYSQAAAGAAVTDTTTETTVASYTIKGGTLAAGKSIAFDALCKTTASNSTDTLLYKVYLGATAIATLTAVDQANDDIAVFCGKLTAYASSSSADVVTWVISNNADATGQASRNFGAVLTGVATSGDLVLSIKATWSAQSASNSCYCASFNVVEL